MAVVLEIPPREHVGVWNRTVLRFLETSQCFEIRYTDFPLLKIGRRWRCLNLMRLNGHLVLLDTWDRWVSLGLFLKAGVFRSVLADVELILRLNRRKIDPFVDRFMSETGKPVTSWTMFPDSRFPLGCFQWRPTEHRFLANLTGCNRRCGRGKWVKAAQDLGDFYVAAERESAEQYALTLENCRWGVCLAGVGDKTRREPEFASCGIPLALNYKPHYPFAFEPDIDYLYLANPPDLNKLKAIDPEPFARRSAELWRDHFSPLGMATSLVRLVEQYCAPSSNHAAI